MTKLAVKKKSKVKAQGKKTKEELRVGIIPTSFYRKAVKDTERKFSLAASALQVPYRASFGQLVFDYLSGGGIVPGIMVQISGTEGSGKSTACVVAFSSAYKERYPVLQYRDPENALSPDLIKNIIHEKPEILFSGENAPATYYDDGGLEKFYSSIKHTLKQLPDKQWDAEEKSWFFVFDSDKRGREMFKAAGFTTYDKKKYEETKRLWVKTDIATPQGFIMLDSYPALLTESEDDDDDQSKAMALDARAFSKNIKRIASRLKRKGFIIVGVNQIRLKPGVMYGCLHSDVTIPFVDGRSFTMQEIVDGKIKGKVWAWDEKAQKFAAAPIVNWFNNGDVTKESDWITISSNEAVATKNGVVSTTVTPDHKILTDKGWKKAEDVTVGDDILSKYPSILNGTLEQFVLGAALGDSTLVRCHAKTSASMRLQDRQNHQYLAWKLKKLEALNFSAWKDKHSSQPSHELSLLKELVKDRNPLEVYEKLSPLSLAVLYMDDGHFKADRERATISLKRFKGDKITMANIAHSFLEQFDIGWSVWEDGVLAIDRESEDRFFKLIRKYVPKCMQYKLPEAHRDFYKEFTLKHKAIVKEQWIPVTSVTRGSDRKFRKKAKYDIEVKGFHNYLAGNLHNGFVVHNSPEYEPGGEALKFYSSLRFRVRKVSAPQTMPEGRTNDGNKTREFSTEKSIYGEKRNDNYVYINVVNTKNKTGTPYLRAKARILFSDGKGRMMGYDPVWDVIEYLKHTMRISGSFKKGFKMDVPALEAKMPGITKQTLDYMDLKLLVTAEATKEPELLKRVKAKFKKWTPVIRKVLFKEIHTPDKLANVILEANNKREKNSDEDEDLEA